MEENQFDTGHISTQYHKALDEILSKTLEMSGIVEASYSDALAGLINGESSLSKKVATDDFIVVSTIYTLTVSYTHLTLPTKA